MKHRITDAFAKAKAAKRGAFVAYLSRDENMLCQRLTVFEIFKHKLHRMKVYLHQHFLRRKPALQDSCKGRIQFKCLLFQHGEHFKQQFLA